MPKQINAAASRWRKAIRKVIWGLRSCKGFTSAGKILEARRRAVLLRHQSKRQSIVHDFSDETARLSIVQKDYFGDHALLYVCENPNVIPPMISQLLSIEPAMAKDRRKCGDFPLHYLCRNPGASEAVLKAFIDLVPLAVTWKGKMGMLPLHIICFNDKVEFWFGA